MAILNGGKRIYLAARYSRREELCRYRRELENEGHTVTSRWLNGNHQVADMGAEGSPEERERFALEDWNDLQSAEVVISFTEPSRTGPTRGGRHVEFGAAVAWGMRCVVVGHRENVFHCLPDVEFYETWEQALLAMEEL